MKWDAYIKGFGSYLRLERSLSANSVEAYLHDIRKLEQFLLLQKAEITPLQVELRHLQAFLQWISWV
jgi:integrase/recombinase XerD